MERKKKKTEKNTTEGGKKHKKNWKEYTTSVEDIKAFLADRIFLRHNVITGRVVRRSLDEMRSVRQMMAVAGGNTDTDDTDNYLYQSIKSNNPALF